MTAIDEGTVTAIVPFVKLSRSCDAQIVLSNRKKLSSMPGIAIKPDQTPEVRKIESLLLKERRQLINSGVNRGSIKIPGNVLFVNQQNYCLISNMTFKRVL